MYTGSLSKFLSSYIIERSGNQSSNQEEEYFFIPERSQSKHLFFTRNIQNEPMKIFGEKNGLASYFSHMAPCIVKGVCILINPFVRPKVDYSYANDSVNDSVVSK